MFQTPPEALCVRSVPEEGLRSAPWRIRCCSICDRHRTEHRVQTFVHKIIQKQMNNVTYLYIYKHVN